jgi:hypothetical protein
MRVVPMPTRAFLRVPVPVTLFDIMPVRMPMPMCAPIAAAAAAAAAAVRVSAAV